MFFQLCFAFDVEKIVENNFVGIYLSRFSLLTSEDKK